MIEIILPGGAKMELDAGALDAAIGVIEWYRDYLKDHEPHAIHSIDHLDLAALELSSLGADGLDSLEEADGAEAAEEVVLEEGV